MARGLPRYDELFYRMMDQVLGARLPHHAHFMLRDPLARRTYVGEARFTEDEKGMCCAEQVVIRPLKHGERITDYLNTIAKGRPPVVICDGYTTGKAINETVNISRRGGRYLVACANGLVRLFPAASGAYQRSEIISPVPGQETLIEPIRNALGDLITIMAENVQLPPKFFAAVQDNASDTICGVFLEHTENGLKPLEGIGIGKYKNNPSLLADWLAENLPDMPMVCSASIVDDIMKSSTGVSAGYYHVAQRGERKLEIFAPLSGVHPDMAQAVGKIATLLKETLRSGKIPEHVYVITLHPKNEMYYGANAYIKYDGIDKTVTLNPPYAHYEQSANEIAAHLMRNYPELPLVCDTPTLDEICAIHPMCVSMDGNHRIVTGTEGLLEVYFPDPRPPADSGQHPEQS